MGSKIEKKFELSKIILIIFSIVTIIAVFSTNFVFANNDNMIHMLLNHQRCKVLMVLQQHLIQKTENLY